MFGLGQAYLERAIRAAMRRGERFLDHPGDLVQRTKPIYESQPPLGIGSALGPLIVTLLALNVIPSVLLKSGHVAARSLGLDVSQPMSDWHGWQGACCRLLMSFPEDPTLAIFLGLVASMWAFRRRVDSVWRPLGDGFLNGLIAIGATCSVVGFGAVLKDLPAFQRIVSLVTHIPGDPLIGAALAIAVIAGLAGSASGGQGIALPIIKPIYIDTLGVAPRALHRIVSIASGTLDSLPANGYVVTLIRNICGDTHANAYGPIFVTTVLIPMVGAALAIGLFKLFPTWAWM
jgi:H+/gluconate symporter-like permease